MHKTKDKRWNNSIIGEKNMQKLFIVFVYIEQQQVQSILYNIDAGTFYKLFFFINHTFYVFYKI